MRNAEGLGLDMSIISAMFKQDNIGLDQRKSQLRMAFELDRVDYARDVVFNISNPGHKMVSLGERKAKLKNC